MWLVPKIPVSRKKKTVDEPFSPSYPRAFPKKEKEIVKKYKVTSASTSSGGEENRAHQHRGLQDPTGWYGWLGEFGQGWDGTSLAGLP